MAINKMKAIDYNSWLTLIDMIASRVKESAHIYNIVNVNIPVLPSYPRDLSKFVKPSIIIQKVSTSQSLLGFGGFIGQHFDVDTNTLMDVHGIEHDMTFQIDVVCDSNTQSSLFVSLISEEVLNTFRIVDGGKFDLKDYTIDFKNPVKIGSCKLINDIDITNLESNNNHDYVTAIRFDVIVTQVIVPNQEFVDLGKWFKYKQIIKL